MDDVFARVRLRVSEVTNGGEVPWYASQINTPFLFTERSADAPPPPDVAPVVDLREKPMRSYSSVEDAYAAALECLDPVAPVAAKASLTAMPMPFPPPLTTTTRSLAGLIRRPTSSGMFR